MGSLGVAPLAGLDDEKAGLVEQFLRFIYNHLNDCYGFKDLYRAKEKYSPHRMASCILRLSAQTSNSRYVLRSRENPESGFH